MIVDTMGGDNSCEELTKGACIAAREFNTDIVAVGDISKMQPVVDEMELADRVRLVDAAVYVTMEDDHYAVRADKADSSMVRAMKLLAAGEGDAVVTAGNTGAAITSATLYVKRIRGIRRAALSPIMPMGKDGVILIDCGANVECTSEYLLQFAYMGALYAKHVFKNPSPSVGLLNVGAESTKGDPLRLETYALLSEAKAEGRLNFFGNVEGRDVPLGVVDVVVADGFSGNVLLKSMEGMGIFFMQKLKEALTATTMSKIGAMLVKKHLSSMKKALDYKEVGGSPLIGISAPVIKAHGSSDAYSMRSAIRQAMLYKEAGVVEKINDNIEHMKTNA